MSKDKKDYLVRGIDKGGNFRFFGANSRNLVNEACMKHQTSPVASAALGRTLTANVMMGSMLKRDQDRVSIIIADSIEIVKRDRVWEREIVF